MKLGRLRRCVPAWKTRPVRRNGLAQGQALRDIFGAGLLAINILAGLSRQSGGGGVPVWTGGDQHGVNIIAGQQVAQIAVRGAILVAVLLVGLLLDGLAARGLNVADGHELHIRFPHEAAQIVSAAIADADAAQDNAFAGRARRRPSPERAGYNLRHQQQAARFEGGIQKAPTGELFLGLFAMGWERWVHASLSFQLGRRSEVLHWQTQGLPLSLQSSPCKCGQGRFGTLP